MPWHSFRAAGRSVSLGLLTVAAGACSDPRPNEQWEVGRWVETSWGYSLRSWTQSIPGNPDTLRLGVSLANRTPQAVQFGLGCGTLVRAYRSAERTGEPAWDRERAVTIGCTSGAVRRTLAPGDTVPTDIWTVELPGPARILADSLPEGVYHFSISPPLELNPTVSWPPPHPSERGLTYEHSPPVRIWLPAGSVELRRRSQLRTEHQTDPAKPEEKRDDGASSGHPVVPRARVE